MRLVTDFTCLNRCVKRPVHPFPSAADIAKGIPSTAKYFCKLDALKGYHQVPLDEESRKLTTFLLPDGKYRYKRGPMGLSSTGDWWCHKSDAVIIGIPGSDKIVDDILLSSDTLDGLFEKIEQVLKRCQAAGLTIARKKMSIGTTVNFAGFIISDKGVEPDPGKISAIKDFPSPVDISTVRSFLGLANQLGHFIPDLAMATTKIRGLLKKGVAFQWLPEHEDEFLFVKNLLTSPMIVHFFDPDLPTPLLTDASKLHGIGYALVQHGKDGRLRLVQAGSRSLAPAEKNYAPIEAECLAAVWGITKCRYFLYGCQNFNLVTDHQPLIGIFRKDISEVENRRLQRFREKIVDYSFTVEWVEGKTHLIADALSRSPVDTANDQAFLTVRSVLHSLDPQLDSMRAAAASCPLYQRLLHAVQNMSTSEFKQLSSSDPLSLYKSVWNELSVHEDNQLVLYQTDRIVVPQSERSRILELLHQGHSGIAKTRQLARQLYYWPGLSNDVKLLVENCHACFGHLPAQQQMPLNPTTASHPLEHTSADLFSLRGKSYLAYSDRFSGMLWCERLNSTTTTAVTGVLERWMYETGFPRSIRTDGGPQFRGPFKAWCNDLHITHEVSSPYNPQSNGHAESAVKCAKYLLGKVDANMRQFRAHLYAWRNTPRADGFAPADLFYSYRQRTALPSVRSPFCSIEAAASARSKSAARAKEHFDAHSSPLSPLLPGTSVSLRDQQSGSWGGQAQAEVESVRQDGLSYNLALPDGSQTIRNRRLIRPKQVHFEEDK